ncbi:MAG TPA: hypothetical protein VN920_02845 [Pyrinomonadaceae bacterium]|nr:hypothetical protein [Pyrinomonadaceae bacterium]
MAKTAVNFFCLALFVISIAAQQPKVIPGTPSELKGVTRIHVAADTESARNSIVEVIKRGLPQLTVTDKAEDAQAWLVFRSDRRNFPKSNPTSGLVQATGNPTYEEFETVGTGQVIKPITRDTARRLIEFKDVSGSVMADNLSRGFANAFIKSYKKANED